MAAKKGNISIDLKGLGKGISSFFTKHGALIFIVLSFGLLTYSVYVVNNLLTAPDDMTYVDQKESESINTRFDKATIDKIDQLKTEQSSGGTLTLPAGRINPFAE